LKSIKILVVMSVLVISGCSTVAPQYQAAFENTQALKNNADAKVAVGEFQAADEKVNHLTIRGGNFAAPTNGSYVEYLKKALEQELYDANRLADDATVTISGTLLENEIDASSFTTGVAHVKASLPLRTAPKPVIRGFMARISSGRRTSSGRLPFRGPYRSTRVYSVSC
jgi:hypothetical protein